MYMRIFSQEDFQSMTYGFKMADQVTDMRATGMMKEVEDDLNRVLKVSILSGRQKRLFFNKIYMYLLGFE